jgi:hypothetical protein
MRNMGILDAVRESAEVKANSRMSEGLKFAHINFERQSCFTWFDQQGLQLAFSAAWESMPSTNSLDD